MWNRGAIWGIPVEVNMDEIKANLKGGKMHEDYSPLEMV